MTITKINRTTYEYSCDQCGETDTADEWPTEQMKAEGWIIKRNGDEYMHFCDRGCLEMSK